MFTKLLNLFQRKKVVGTIPSIDEIIEDEMNTTDNIQLKSDLLNETLIQLYNEGNEQLAFDLAERFSLINTEECI